MANNLPFVEIPAEKSGLTDGIDATVKYPWMGVPVDLNGDGHLDLMYYGHHGGGAGIWFGKGDGTFTFDSSGYTARWVFGERDPTWWDPDGDGFMDGIASPAGRSVLHVNDGTGHWKASNLQLAGMFADLDGDGHHDEILEYKRTAGAVMALEPPFSQWGKGVPENVEVKTIWLPVDVVGWPKDLPKPEGPKLPNGFREAYSVDLDGDDRNELVLFFVGPGGFNTDKLRGYVLEREAESKGPADWKDVTAARGLPDGLGHWLYPEDLDVDGDLDLADLYTGEWYANDGKGTFTKSQSRLHLGKKTNGTSHVDNDSEVWFMDLDNNGFRDLVSAADHTPSFTTILNLGGGTFVESLSVKGNRRGRKFGDVDHDGDLDMIVTQKLNLVLMRNDTSNLGLHVKLVPKIPAEAALGCKLWVYRAGSLGDEKALLHYRQVFQGRAQERSNILDTKLHVGLGKAETADIRVRFPSGEVREVKGAKARSVVEVKE
ncbi:MAG: CRTAC1 family protein [Planctomycetota bacterium]|nr:CRTAC1 family protein [Planctomycetota bacterium]